MRRLIACAVLVPLLLMTWTPMAHAGKSTDIALGLASFAVFNQVVAPFIYRPRYAEAAYHRREVVYTTVVTQPPVVYQPAPVVYAPPAVVAAPVSTVVYPHGRYELQLHGHQYVWVWIPTAGPPPPPAMAPPPAPMP